MYDAVLDLDPNYVPALHNKIEVLEKMEKLGISENNKTEQKLDYQGENNKTEQKLDYQGESIGVTETRQLPESRKVGIFAVFSEGIVGVLWDLWNFLHKEQETIFGITNWETYRRAAGTDVEAIGAPLLKKLGEGKLLSKEAIEDIRKLLVDLPVYGPEIK